jgi:hypothetical protein
MLHGVDTLKKPVAVREKLRILANSYRILRSTMQGLEKNQSERPR